MLTLEQIRAAVPPVPVELPELGITAHLHAMTGAVRLALTGHPDKESFGHRLLAETVRDVEGAALLTEDLVRELPTVIIDRLYAVAAKINGLQPSAVEDAAGNSAAP